MHELVLLAPEAHVELLSDALMELDAQSVSVEDADADSPAEAALFGEPGLPAPKAGWERSTVRALFDSEPAASGAAGVLLAQPWGGELRIVGLQPVADQDWVRLTQAQFAPVEVTPAFWIVPSWHAAPPAARRVIRLDPGLAFGTGTHPTTRMCLRWIAQHAARSTDARVLDYGCGSGILAIGAMLFGAASADAVDIDPAAVAATRDNALANGVRLGIGSPELCGPPAAAYEVVLANILAVPLKVLAPLLSAHLAPGGDLVLAGLLERQVDELQAAYAPMLSLKVADSEDGWVLLTGRRPGPDGAPDGAPDGVSSAAPSDAPSDRPGGVPMASSSP